MSSIIASHIPTTVDLAKVRDFFSFCGKIKTINPIDKSDKFQSFEITFESSKALSTALLLHDAELDGVPIEVKESTPGARSVTDAAGGSGDLPPQYSEVGDHKVQTTGDSKYDDISQEEKPKYAIMAQLLSNGYVVSDKVVQKSIDFDKEKGISSTFKNFLTSLDEKYIHSQEPDSSANKNLSKAQSTLESWGNQIANSSYSQTLSQYYDKAASHPYGVKVHEFYKSISKDVQSIHEEAKRLAELKKQGADKNSATSEASTEAPELPART